MVLARLDGAHRQHEGPATQMLDLPAPRGLVGHRVVQPVRQRHGDDGHHRHGAAGHQPGDIGGGMRAVGDDAIYFPQRLAQRHGELLDQSGHADFGLAQRDQVVDQRHDAHAGGARGAQQGRVAAADPESAGHEQSDAGHGRRVGSGLV